MRTYIGHHEIVNAVEFEELALDFTECPAGLDSELFRGPLRPETAQERQAREDVARQVIAELRELGENGDEIAAWDALYADALTRTVPLLHTAAHTETLTGLVNGCCAGRPQAVRGKEAA